MVEAAAIGVAASLARASGPADRLVAGEDRVADEESRAGAVEETAPSPLAAFAAEGASTADGLVVAEGAVANTPLNYPA